MVKAILKSHCFATEAPRTLRKFRVNDFPDPVDRLAMSKSEIIKLVTLEINRLREVAKTRQPIPRSSQESRLFRKWNKGSKHKYYLFPVLFNF